MGSSSDSDDDREGNFYSTLREQLIRPAPKSNGSQAPSPAPSQLRSKCKQSLADIRSQLISSVIEQSVNKENNLLVDKVVEPKLHFFVRLYNVPQKSWRETVPIRIMTLTESKKLYPDLPHSWLCGGRLLQLQDPSHAINHSIFQVPF